MDITFALIRIFVVVFVVSMGLHTTLYVIKFMPGHEYFLFAIAIALSCNALPSIALSFIIWNATRG